MNRNNFTRAVLVEMAIRCTRPDGQKACENCGAVGVPLVGHHIVMDAMEVDKTRKLTAADGKMLCAPCHDPITAKQRAELARVQAREASNLGIKKGGRPVQKIAGNPNALQSERRPKHEGRQSLPPRPMFK